MKVSRRSVVRTSLLAPVALCAPQLLAQAAKPAAQDEMSMWSEAMKKSREFTIEVANAMPEEKYHYKPVPEVRGFGQQMVHIAEAVAGMTERFLLNAEKPTHNFSEATHEDVKSKADVIARLNANFDYAEQQLATLKASDLEATTKFFGGRMITKRNALRAILDHNTHHRAQAVVYLRANGIKPPSYRV